MASAHPTDTSPLQVTSEENVSTTSGGWSGRRAAWQQSTSHLSPSARAIFSEPPSLDPGDFPECAELGETILAQGDDSNFFVALRAHDLFQKLEQERTLHRCAQALVEIAMRHVARSLFQELLNDGERSPEEINKLAIQYTHRAFCGSSGLDDVKKLVPEFDMHLVQAEAMRQSLEPLETLYKVQASVRAQREKALEDFQYSIEAAGCDLVRSEPEKPKNSTQPAKQPATGGGQESNR